MCIVLSKGKKKTSKDRSDNMSEKITESQIYLFLADYGNTWKEDADKLDKEDGKVSKYEFKQFLGSEMNGWNGVDISQLSHSVIDNFFAKIDTNSVGSSNFNILDNKELDDMEGNIRAYQMLSEFINEKYKNDFPTSTLDTKYGNSWKWELSDSLTSVIENAIATKKTDEASLKSALNEAYPQAFSLATAQCCVAQYTDSSEIKSLMKGLDYSFENDKTFQTIIKNYIASLGEVTPGSDGAKDINEKIKSIVNDYLATASLGSGNPENVEELGYNKSKLNDLQKARLGQIASNALSGKLTTIDIKDRNGNKIDLTLAGYSEIFQKATAEFVNWYTTSGYKSVSVTPGQALFQAIEADLSANADKLFENSSAFANFKKEVQMTDSYILLDENKDFYNKLVEAGLNEDQLTKIKEQNLPEYKDAYNEILKEILNGNSTYLNSDGSINFNTVDAKLIDILKVKLGITPTVQPEETPKNVKTSIDFATLKDDSAKHSWYLLQVMSDGGIYGSQISEVSLSFLYSFGGRISLLVKDTVGAGQQRTGFNNSLAEAKTNLASFVDFIKNACISDGSYDEAALEVAKNRVMNVYNKAFDTCLDDDKRPRKKGTNDPTIIVEDGQYSYTIKRYSNDSSASACDINGGTLGLTITEGTKGKTWQMILDPKALMDLFAKFYKEALGK